VISTVKNGGIYKMTVNGTEVEVDEEMLDIRIAAKEGYDVEMDNNLFVILDTNLTKELIDEGFAREFISKIQQMRKSNSYEMMDNIKIFYNGAEEIQYAVKIFDEYIKSETLAVSIEKTDDTSYEVQNLNGFDTGIKLEKVN
jgi:isoleucyl-tRNA synthetase